MSNAKEMTVALPWGVEIRDGGSPGYGYAVTIVGSDGEVICRVPKPNATANAALIVRAVNRDSRFTDMVAALEEARLQLEYMQEKYGHATGETILARVRAALSNAKASTS